MLYRTQVLPVDKDSVTFLNNYPDVSDETTKSNLQLAAKEVRKPGRVVAFPTETVYGLGASALDDNSVKAIFDAKNRPADNPLIVHVCSIEQVDRLILTESHSIPQIYHKLVKKFWPGPLTILLPFEKGCPISKFVTAGQNTIGVRMPAHAIARSLIALSDTPLAAPSANVSTKPSPTLASHVKHDLDGKIEYILDGGACSVGVESTVVDGLCDPPMLLRPGGISAEDIKKFGGDGWESLVIAKKIADKLEAVRTPGMKYRHYSPSAKVVLFLNCGDGKAAVSEYLKGFSGKLALLKSKKFASAEQMGLHDVFERDLGSTAGEMAHALFRELRAADGEGVDLILVEGIEESGDGRAVMNRLAKAASETIDGSSGI